MRFILITSFCFLSCKTEKLFSYKKKWVNPLTFNESFLTYNDSISYDLKILDQDDSNPIEIEKDFNGKVNWIVNYIYGIERIDYKYLGEVSKNKYALIIRFNGGTLSSAKILITEIRKDSVHIIVQKDISTIPEDGIFANYKYFHLRDEHINLKNITKIDFKPKKKKNTLQNFKKDFLLQRHKIPFLKTVSDLIQISIIDGQPRLTFYSFEDFDYFNRAKKRIENLNLGDNIIFSLKDGDSILLKYYQKPKIVLEDKDKLVKSNFLYLSKENVKKLSKSKIISIKTKKREYLFKGHPNYNSLYTNVFEYQNIPNELKSISKEIYKQLN